MKRPLLAKVILALTGTVLGLLAAELLIRAVKPQLFEVHPPGMYILDPDVGYVLTPGFEGEVRRPEFRARFTIGQAGLRGTELRPRRPDTVRILVLGDSLAWGFGVTDEETLTRQLETLLAVRLPKIDVQVLNAAVPGYGTADELAFLRSRGAALEPDLVVVQFLDVNDFEENRVPARGWAVLQDGMLASKLDVVAALDWPFHVRLKTWLKSHSHLAHLAFDRLGYIAMRWGVADRVGGLLQDGGAFTVEDARQTRGLLVEIARVSQDLGARSLFVLTTGQASVISDDPLPPRAAEVLEQAAAEAGVRWLDVTPILRQRDDRLRLFYPQDGHWTALGHRAVAEILCRELVEGGMLEADFGNGSRGAF